MTETVNPQVTGSQGSATGQAGAAGVQGTAGSAAGAAGYSTQGFEGSIKQSSDVNTEEALAVVQALNPKMAEFFSNLIAINAKRTYDQAQSLDLSTQVGDNNQRATLNNLATQALQNAVETANMVGKQAVRHSDIAIDRQWNLNETDYAGVEALRGNTFKDAIAGAVAAAVAQALAAQKA
jgi:hypothetical protein